MTIECCYSYSWSVGNQHNYLQGIGLHIHYRHDDQVLVKVKLKGQGEYYDINFVTAVQQKISVHIS